jgi:hypothetical protein
LSDEQVLQHVKLDARDYTDLHASVEKLVAMRGQAPSGGEPISGPFPRGSIRSLHVGSGRAVTAWDPAENVCWLLAFDGYHRNGEADDAYNVFIDLYNANELHPTSQDYKDLFDAEDDGDDEDMIPGLRDVGERLLARARANPGREEVETFTDGGRQVICVDIVIDGDAQLEEGWLGITLPQDEAISNEEIYGLVQALLPPDVTPTYVQRFRDRERRRGEIVFHWEYGGPLIQAPG